MNLQSILSPIVSCYVWSILLLIPADNIGAVCQWRLWLQIGSGGGDGGRDWKAMRDILREHSICVPLVFGWMGTEGM